MIERKLVSAILMILKSITFVDGMYSYEDLNDYIHQYMIREKHTTKEKYPINLQFVLSSFRVVIELDDD